MYIVFNMGKVGDDSIHTHSLDICFKHL